MTPATKPTQISHPSSEAAGGTNGWPSAVSTSAAALPALATAAASEAAAAAAGVRAGAAATAWPCSPSPLPLPLAAALPPRGWSRRGAAPRADPCACGSPCPWQQRQSVPVRPATKDIAKQRFWRRQAWWTCYTRLGIDVNARNGAGLVASGETGRPLPMQVPPTP